MFSFSKCGSFSKYAFIFKMCFHFQNVFSFSKESFGCNFTELYYKKMSCWLSLHHWQSVGTCLCSRTILSRSMKLAASANAKQGYVIEMHNLGPPFICVMLCYVVYELNVMLRICSLNHIVCLISGWVNSFWKWKHISKKNNILKMKAQFEKE